MSREVIGHNRAVSGDLHPLVYKAVVGLALWFVLSAWVFFGGWDYMGLLLAVVTGFFLIAMAIPVLLWLTWRRHREPGAAESGSGSFRHWTSGDFAIWQGRLTGSEAAVQVILPIAAVSIGLTLIGIVLVVVAHGAVAGG
jgi:hypothetical protein